MECMKGDWADMGINVLKPTDKGVHVFKRKIRAIWWLEILSGHINWRGNTQTSVHSAAVLHQPLVFHCERMRSSVYNTFRHMLTECLIHFLCLLSRMICVAAIITLNKGYREFQNLSLVHRHFPEVTSELHKLSKWSVKRFLLCVRDRTDGPTCNGNAFPQWHTAICSNAPLLPHLFFFRCLRPDRGKDWGKLVLGRCFIGFT